MSEKLQTLEEWARAHYASPPSIFTLRRWVREERIFPPPKLHGRKYYVEQHARYVDDFNDPSFLEAMRVATSSKQ